MKAGDVRQLIDSIRGRLAFWHALTVATLLVMFAAGSWLFLVRLTGTHADDALQSTTWQFLETWNGELEEHEFTPAQAADSAITDFRSPDERLLVFDSTGRLIALSNIVPLIPALTRLALDNTQRGPVAALLRSNAERGDSVTTLDEKEFRGVPVRAHTHHLEVGGERFLVVALRSMRAERAASRTFAEVVAVAIPIALLLAAFGGYLLARASLAPLVTMAASAERIGVSNLDGRLAVSNPRDELGGLATVINGLLARLEQAFARQRQFMADASHELRTPVAALCSVADVALARSDRDSVELTDALQIMRGEGRRLARIVDDLLLLSRADAGQLPLRPEPLYLEELLYDCARAARGLASARRITLDAPDAPESPFVGDPHLLRRLVMVLLDNGIKYTPVGGRVSLTLARDAALAQYQIAVEDSGPGVPDDLRERIFERFVRADPSRTHSDGSCGAGLGLAIAQWITHAHGATLHLDASGSSGSRFIIRLPIHTNAADGSQLSVPHTTDLHAAGT